MHHSRSKIQRRECLFTGRGHHIDIDDHGGADKERDEPADVDWAGPSKLQQCAQKRGLGGGGPRRVAALVAADAADGGAAK